MTKIINLAVILVSLSICLPVLSQDQDPEYIIQTMKSKVDQIRDYSADIMIEVDVDFIKMPPKHARIFYKKPDKIKFKSNEFIMLPKRGLSNGLTDIMNEPYTAIFMGEEFINSESHYVIRVVPLSKKPDIILATWWINSKDFRIIRSESNTRKDGNIRIDFTYNNDTIDLPAKMTFSFEIEKLSLPLKFIGKSNGADIDKNKQEDVGEGKVYIHFSNYLINSNIPDEFFEEKEKDSK